MMSLGAGLTRITMLTNLCVASPRSPNMFPQIWNASMGRREVTRFAG